jgi:hypothetical protein
MLEILALQVITAILGTTSIGAADWLYHRGRLGQRPHSVWVSASSITVCLPLLTWIIDVYLGDGVISWVLVGALAAIMFLWMYWNLLRVPSVRKARSGLLPLGSSQSTIPPSSNIKG